ncbi:hypothetical protein B0O80DRAFT_444442 [Mortierella sp. GBAus27b]|nr:hypothetical protein BGX31_005795 [Mortierella sp. GBA43]KAI8358293.1 hypothetical protein B0O80DRAFT_444442 [Mortierella sp. GBAus27b]
MDRTLSEVELLDMAREVLTICTDNSLKLKEIIEDLTITKSSQLTINRILDGQFLSPLAPPEPTLHETGDISMVLPSSDDEDSDVGEFLRMMSGTPSSKKESVKRRDPSPPVTTDILPRSSSVAKDRTTSAYQPRNTRSPPPSLSEISTSGSVLDHGNEEDLLTVAFSSKSTAKSRRSEGNFKPMSLLKQSSFSSWDFELVSIPSDGQTSQTVMFTPSRHSSTSTGKVSGTSQGIQDESTVTNKPTTGSMGIRDEYPPVSLRYGEGSSKATRTKPAPVPSPPQLIKRAPKSPSPFDMDLAFKDTSSSSVVRTDAVDNWGDLNDSGFGHMKMEVEDKYTIEIDSMSDTESDHQSRGSTQPAKSRATSAKGTAKSPASGRGTRGKRGLDALSMDTEDQGKSIHTVVDSAMDSLDYAEDTLLASERRAKGKRRLDASIDILGQDSLDGVDWTMDFSTYDEAISLEEEIVKRARRRQQKAPTSKNNDDGDYEDGTEEPAAPSKAELRKAEREAKRLAKETEKAAKAAERAAKKAARDEEQQRKRDLKEKDRLAKEEEKQAEKKAAREVRIANRLSSKAEGTKEMIVCIEESMHQSEFGLVLQDYFASIECQVKVVRVMDTLASSSLGTKSSDNSCPIQDMMYWRRIVSTRYDGDQDLFVPIAEKEVVLESFALIFMTGRALSTMIQQESLRDRISALKRGMRLKRNTERLEMSSMPHHSAMQLKDNREQRQRVVILIEGLESFFRELKKVASKKFEQAVLASMNPESGKDTSFRGKEMEKEMAMDREQIEQELLWLQLEQDCLIMHSNDEEESAQLIISLTEQIGQRPYK